MEIAYFQNATQPVATTKSTKEVDSMSQTEENICDPENCTDGETHEFDSKLSVAVYNKEPENKNQIEFSDDYSEINTIGQVLEKRYTCLKCGRKIHERFRYESSRFADDD